MLDENDLQKLLRLKRYEQPPPDYFEGFLHEFHRRQRAELLRQPLWKIARERVGAFFSELTPPRMAYAMAVTMVLLVAGVISERILTLPREMIIADRATAPEESALGLESRVLLPGIDDLMKGTAHSATASFRPRYVMDARPVSYAPSSSF